MMLPQLGMLGGVPAPRKDRIASTIIAEAATKVPCTRSGGNVLGRICRHRMGKNPVPLAWAASAKGSSRKGSTTPRTRRGARDTAGTGASENAFSERGAGDSTHGVVATRGRD